MTSYNGKTITYNANGGVASYDGWNYTWSNGKLSGISKTSIGSIARAAVKPITTSTKNYTFDYNAFGQRISSQYSHTWTSGGLSPVQPGDVTAINRGYIYDHSGRLIRENISKTIHLVGTESSQIVYLYDASGVVGIEYSKGSNVNTYYFLRNLQGDVVAIYDSNGVKVVEYAYDAWGNCTIKSSTTNYDLANDNPIRYRGYYYDEGTNLYYLNARYYSPEWRRFISPDDTSYLDHESVNGLNLYCYCNNDPVNFVDPSGNFVITLSAVLWAAAIGFGVGAVSGAVYGGITAAANGQDVWAGIGIGALTGGIMGAGAGVASLFIAPILAGGGVAIGATSISAGASLAIGTGISFGTGAIGGAVSDIWTQHVNNGAITDIDSIINSAFQWGFINTFGAFIGSVGGPLSNLETALITGIFNNVTGSVGLTIDAIRGKSTRRKPILA